MNNKKIKQDILDFLNLKRDYTKISPMDIVVFKNTILSMVSKIQIKDNPVPSLDKKDIKFLIKLLKQNAPIGEKLCFNNYGRIISKLQNGVETNKEQPKKYTCIVCLEEFTAVCSNSCGSCLL